MGLIGFGSVCEFLQLLRSGRESSVEDAIANAIGVLLVSGLRRRTSRWTELSADHNREKVMAPRRAPSPMIA